MTDAIIEALSGLPDGWKVFFLAMFPVTELRVALPLGVAWGLPAFDAFLWAIAGNFIPIAPLLLMLRWVMQQLSRIPCFVRPLEKLSAYGHSNGEKVRRWGWLGLMLLVAIPLPGTGVWTGCLVASLLHLDFWHSLSAITLGEIVAGIAVSLVTLSLVSVGGTQAVLILVAVLLLLTVVVFLRRRKK